MEHGLEKFSKIRLLKTIYQPMCYIHNFPELQVTCKEDFLPYKNPLKQHFKIEKIQNHQF
jgi:hypothetical protein